MAMENENHALGAGTLPSVMGPELAFIIINVLFLYGQKACNFVYQKNYRYGFLFDSKDLSKPPQVLSYLCSKEQI